MINGFKYKEQSLINVYNKLFKTIKNNLLKQKIFMIFN
jgi:hypothetical protein